MKDNRSKQAEWIRSTDKYRAEDTDVKMCSACKAEAYFDTDYGQMFFDYCPHCGAKMMNAKNYKLVDRMIRNVM